MSSTASLSNVRTICVLITPQIIKLSFRKTLTVDTHGKSHLIKKRRVPNYLFESPHNAMHVLDWLLKLTNFAYYYKIPVDLLEEINNHL